MTEVLLDEEPEEPDELLPPDELPLDSPAYRIDGSVLRLLTFCAPISAVCGGEVWLNNASNDE
jgi:hypothetical protein